jgi:hypothetical protein
MYKNCSRCIPLDYFDLNNHKEFLSACHYTNLQPMWSIENSEKGNRYEK